MVLIHRGVCNYAIDFISDTTLCMLLIKLYYYYYFLLFKYYL